jgi:hypothetical protein
VQNTTWLNQFEAPSANDPADFALQMGRLADSIDAAFEDLAFWPSHMAYAGGGEVGTPTVYKSITATSTAVFLPNQETAVPWTNVEYDNTGTQGGTGELILPTQDQRYWWWCGVNLLVSAASANARYTTRLYVQDRDPATGQLLTGAYRYNQYMTGASGDQYMTFDGLFRTGGGRLRVTLSHGNTNGSVNVLAGSSVWAVRICPDR